MNKGMYSSKSSRWETPNDFFLKLNNEFNFNVDVCATEESAKCPAYFNEEIDGLNVSWEGMCFMNPPYGKEISKWIEKAYNESRKNDCIVVALIPSRTDTKWWHDYVMKASEIRFVKGRLKFSDSKNSAPFPSAVVIWNGNSNLKVRGMNK